MSFDFFAEFNSKAQRFDIDTRGFEYRSLKDLFNDYGKDMVYPVRAMYINRKSRYADSPVIATDSFFVNLPSHLTKSCEKILEQQEAIDMINSGTVGFTIYQYHNNKYDRDCFSVKIVPYTPQAEEGPEENLAEQLAQVKQTQQATQTQTQTTTQTRQTRQTRQSNS